MKCTKLSARYEYVANATIAEQLRARARIARLLQLAFIRYGVENVTTDTNWIDLIPPEPPCEEMRPFYGEEVSPAIDVAAELDAGDIAYKVAAPRGDRANRGKRKARD